MSIAFMPPGGSRGEIKDDVRSNLHTEDAAGAVIYPDYATREVKIYPVFESEVRSLSAFNTLGNVAFSVAASLASTATGIWINAAFAGNPTAEGTILSRVFAPCLCALALAVLLLALWAIRQRKSVWSAIDRESKS
jgi:hypothetical protein